MRERFISVIFTFTETGFFHIKRIVRQTSCRSSVVMQGTNERRKVKSIIPVSAGIHRLTKKPENSGYAIAPGPCQWCVGCLATHKQTIVR